MKKLVSGFLVLMLLFACVMGSASAENAAVKIGVLVSDATSSEALAFRAYYTEYLQKMYPVEFVYSDAVADAAEEKTAIDNFIALNCKAVISISTYDRVAQIDQCEMAGVYYGLATSALSPEQYDEYKDYEYFVGSIGPSVMTEYQAGYDEARFFLDQGMTKFGLFGGALPYYAEMHVYRAAGMLAAMCEVGGGEYKGVTGEAIVGQIYADGCKIEPCQIGSVELAAYTAGYDFTDAWFGQLAQMVNIEGMDAILTVGSGADIMGSFIANTDVALGTIDAFTDVNKSAMENGILDYLAGKFPACIGPIFVATLNAVNGHQLRTADGSAFMLDQGYWVATDLDTFNTYYEACSSITDPVYDKALMDRYCGADVTYEAFADFISKYSYEEIMAIK